MSEHAPVLLHIRSHVGGVPLFLVHSALGSTGYYASLARELTHACPVYGINCVGLFGDRPPLQSVEEMARYYIDVMRSACPHGPYIVGGHSSGAYIAFEMCLQLPPGEAPLCVMIDQPAPLRSTSGRAEPLTDLTQHVINLMTLIAMLYVQPLPESPAQMKNKLESLDERAQIAQIATWLRQLRFLPASASDEMAAAFLGVLVANYSAAASWSPGTRRYAGRVGLVRVTDSDMPDAAYDRWKNHCAGEIEVRMIPGNHATLMSRPYVETLGARLGELLKTVT